MATTTKSAGGLLPDRQLASDWNRHEPLITAEKLRNHHLFGIPLVSAIKDPTTGKAQVLGDELISEIILRAVSIAESDAQIEIFPTQHNEKLPFDRNEYEHFGYISLRHRPVASIEKLSVVSSTDTDLYVIPLEWIEVANLYRGQLNIVPIIVGVGAALGTIPSPATGTSNGSAFLTILSQKPWIPSFWQVNYTTGFPDGMVPRIVNELIGTVAAMEVLSMLAATYARTQSYSLGIDGMSQSISSPGPALFDNRIAALEKKKGEIIKKLKSHFGMKLFSGSV